MQIRKLIPDINCYHIINSKQVIHKQTNKPSLFIASGGFTHSPLLSTSYCFKKRNALDSYLISRSSYSTMYLPLTNATTFLKYSFLLSTRPRCVVNATLIRIGSGGYCTDALSNKGVKTASFVLKYTATNLAHQYLATWLLEILAAHKVGFILLTVAATSILTVVILR